MRLVFLALTLMAAGGVLAETPAPRDQPIKAVRHGYALHNPDILLRQRIFGIAHGIHLLYSACLDKAENAAAVQLAYDAWHPLQEKAVTASYLSLAAHHFGALAERANWQDVARLFNLKETIYPSLGAISLLDACASFPAALRQPRYDFAAQLQTS